MANLKQIRKRIRSVKSTQQITRVMEMVSASKLARTQMLLNQAMPYAEGLEGIMKRLVASFLSEDESVVVPNPFMRPKPEIHRRCMVVVTSDRGLCGSFNNNVIQQAEAAMGEGMGSWVLACVGKKCVQYFQKRGWSVQFQLIDCQGRISGEQIHDLSKFLTDGFLANEFDEVQLAYTEFRSAARYAAALDTFIPVKPEASEENVEYIFEPDAKGVLDRIVPDYLAGKMNTTILQSLAAEHAARMTAMRNATDNASEMIDSLTLDMNKARQAAITTEISEIVGGSEAIKG